MQNSIPKIIHYAWFGGKEKPDYLIKNIESWKKFCPDYEIKEWNEQNFDINSNQYLKEAIEHKKWAFASDYIRLKVVYDQGGIYLDTDVELMKSMDGFLDANFFSNFENLAMICFAVYGATPGCSVLKEMLDSYEDRPFVINKKKNKLDLTTNVILGATLLREKFGAKLDNTYQNYEVNGEKLVFYPNDYFFAEDYVSREVTITENCHGIHFYASSWIGKKQKKEDKFVEDLRKFLGDKLFRKVMKKFLIARVNRYAKVFWKREKQRKKTHG
jgi:mannosyltransferase OCH1-like enzyme